MEKYSPDTVVDRIVQAINQYISKQREEHAEMHCYKKKVSTELTYSCVWHFIAIVYYFVLVALPNKRDYWSTEEWMPRHPQVTKFGLAREHFNFFWQHFHVAITEEDENETTEMDGNDVEGNDVEEDELVEAVLERIHQ
eukprot:9198723-Ditylum_brightwellii.AAC.1